MVAELEQPELLARPRVELAELPQAADAEHEAVVNEALEVQELEVQLGKEA
jgi:hypothetical protein